MSNEQMFYIPKIVRLWKDVQVNIGGQEWTLHADDVAYTQAEHSFGYTPIYETLEALWVNHGDQCRYEMVCVTQGEYVSINENSELEPNMPTRHIPVRIQRSRRAGAMQPPNTVYCGRSSKWGNPYKVKAIKAGADTRYGVFDPDGSLYVSFSAKASAVNMAVVRYSRWLDEQLQADPSFLDGLRHADYLSCWCGLKQSCHVDMILRKLATESEKPEVPHKEK